MPTVKTAISLPEPLFQRAEVVAHDLQISRSQLVAMALAEFVKHYERNALVQAINQAFEAEPSTSEERELLEGIRATTMSPCMDTGQASGQSVSAGVTARSTSSAIVRKRARRSSSSR